MIPSPELAAMRAMAESLPDGDAARRVILMLMDEVDRLAAENRRLRELLPLAAGDHRPCTFQLDVRDDGQLFLIVTGVVEGFEERIARIAGGMIGEALDDRAEKNRALVRLLWRAIADIEDERGSETCDADECQDGSDRLDVCDAMRALGWGEHWDAEEFKRRAAEVSRG